MVNLFWSKRPPFQRVSKRTMKGRVSQVNNSKSSYQDGQDNGDDEDGQFTNNGSRNSNDGSCGIVYPLEVEQHVPASMFEMLEMELQETEDLLAEAAADGGVVVFDRNQKISRRRNATQQRLQKTAESTATSIHRWIGIMRSQVGHAFGMRNFALLCILGAFVLLLVHMLDWNLERSVPQDVAPKPPHTTSFGGANNPGHYQTAPWNDALDLPKDNSGAQVLSCSRENIQNLNGHYWHDPVKSPYASPLYKANNSTEAIAAQQARFDRDMKITKEMNGAWVQPNFTGLVRPTNFHTFAHKDMPGSDFPPNAWQRDKNYLTSFLGQAQALVKRVQFAIYREYGHAGGGEQFAVLKYNSQATMTSKVRVSMDSGVATLVDTDGKPRKCVAFLEERAWEGLARKLLHSMMSEDEFYVVAAGGPHLYRGHNLWRTQVMQFQQVMEPVFDKLGMRLVTRNMGMDASTIISALGGADVYGESDLFWYLPDTRGTADAFVESEGQIDMLQRQAILSGERVPIVLTSNPGTIAEQGQAWVGNIQQGRNICPEVTMDIDFNGTVSLPELPACAFVNCAQAVIDAGLCRDHKSHCWVERSDWNPSLIDTQQQASAGFEDYGYPTDRQHQLEGRKLALLVLHGLDEALKLWMADVETNQLPLSDDKWHVGETYKSVRESVRTLERRPGTAASVPSCEVLLRGIDPMICHMAMHVHTEWTPRINPDNNRLFDVLSDKLSVFDNTAMLDQLYIGIDLLPSEWQMLDGGTDNDDGNTHLAAIATYETVPTKNLTSIDNQGILLHAQDDDFDGTDDLAGLVDDIFHGRLLSDASRPKIAADKWTLYELPLGFCDGSSQSTCNRRVGNSCLLANRNHYRAGLVGHGDAGWLNISVALTEGIIMLRFDWDLNLASNTIGGANRLDDVPEDFSFDYSINGELTTLNRDEFKAVAVALADDLIVHPVLVDRSMSAADERTDSITELGIRVRSSKGLLCKIMLSHVYYA